MAKAVLGDFSSILTGEETAPAISTTNLDGDQQRLKRENQVAYSQLMLCCGGVSYGMVEDSKTEEQPFGCARTAWEKLSAKYAPTTKQHKILVKKLFLTCRMKGDKSDPDEWFQQLDHLQ